MLREHVHACLGTRGAGLGPGGLRVDGGLAEGLIQGIIGTALGIVAGYGLGLLGVAAMGPMLSEMMNVDIGAPVVSPGLLIGSAVIGIGVTLLAGLLPAMSAGRVTPLEALRPSVGVVSLKRLMGFGFWAGVVLIALAVAALLTQNIAFIGIGAVLFVVGLILVAPALVRM